MSTPSFTGFGAAVPNKVGLSPVAELPWLQCSCPNKAGLSPVVELNFPVRTGKAGKNQTLQRRNSKIHR